MLEKSKSSEHHPASLSADSKEVEAGRLSGRSPLSSGIGRFFVLRLARPLEDFLVRMEVAPNWISALGLFITLFGCFLWAVGWLASGAILILFGGAFDFLDGRVARRRQLASREGAFLDSVLDRVMDAGLFFALAFYFRDSWVLWVCLVAFLGSSLTPYVRAKAESLGVESKDGLVQRPERIVILALGALLSALLRELGLLFESQALQELGAWSLIAALGLLAILSNHVALKRARSCFRELQGKSLN